MSSQLQNPPLVEALLEVKWDLKKKGSPDSFEDPGYKLANGRLFDRVRKKFGFFKNLPVTMVPEEITPYTVRNQFRSKPEGWPLIQIGPGVATVNITPPYTWTEFKRIIKFFGPNLYESYDGVVPEEPNYKLHLNSVLLRYINGIEWDWSTKNTLEFLLSKLNTKIELPPKIAEENREVCPLNLNLQIGYPYPEPKGQSIIRIGTGTIGQSKGIVLELLFLSSGNDAPQLDNIELFMKWVTDAHAVIEKSFFSLIEGELHQQFKGG